jgi:hypothetical protein
MGGVHIVPHKDGYILPLMWRSLFPHAIQTRLVMFKNPGRDINNSDLELAASATQHDILAQQFDVRESTIQNSSDNVATVWWQRNGATSYSGPTAGLLCLHFQSRHQRHYLYIPLFDYIAGEANAMEHACSRMWHLTDSHLLAYLNSNVRRVGPGSSAHCASQCTAH